MNQNLSDTVAHPDHNLTELAGYRVEKLWLESGRAPKQRKNTVGFSSWIFQNAFRLLRTKRF